MLLIVAAPVPRVARGGGLPRLPMSHGCPAGIHNVVGRPEGRSCSAASHGWGASSRAVHPAEPSRWARLAGCGGCTLPVRAACLRAARSRDRSLRNRVTRPPGQRTRRGWGLQSLRTHRGYRQSPLWPCAVEPRQSAGGEMLNQNRAGRGPGTRNDSPVPGAIPSRPSRYGGIAWGLGCPSSSGEPLSQDCSLGELEMPQMPGVHTNQGARVNLCPRPRPLRHHPQGVIDVRGCGG